MRQEFLLLVEAAALRGILREDHRTVSHVHFFHLETQVIILTNSCSITFTQLNLAESLPNGHVQHRLSGQTGCGQFVDKGWFIWWRCWCSTNKHLMVLRLLRWLILLCIQFVCCPITHHIFQILIESKVVSLLSGIVCLLKENHLILVLILHLSQVADLLYHCPGLRSVSGDLIEVSFAPLILWFEQEIHVILESCSTLLVSHLEDILLVFVKSYRILV